MKTRNAIFWGTSAIVITLIGQQSDGVTKYVCAGLLFVSLLMLNAQTRGKDNDD